MSETLDKFLKLIQLDVTEWVEKRKDGNTELTYLSWCNAWKEFKKVYPDARYSINKFANEKGMLVPYMFDEETGYMVNTEIKADNIVYEMWLPVMNSANKAMKHIPYKYKVKEYKYENGKSKWTGKYIDKEVESATMFDINKAIMRCLVKNMAMFGLGLYIYAGEDLPENIEPETEPDNKQSKEISIKSEIVECATETKLKTIYKKYKTEITSNKELLDLITQRANEIRKSA